MKILIVSQYFWPENFKINDFAIGMKQSGHEIVVLTGKPNYPSGRFYPGYGFFGKRTEYYEGIKIIRSQLIPRGKGSGIRLILNYFSFALFSLSTALFRIREKFDVVFVFEVSPITVGIPAVYLKKRLGIPMFFWVLDLWPETVELVGNVRSKPVLNALNRLVIHIYKWSDRILISSRSFRDSVMNKNVDPGKIVYYPNWAEDIYLVTEPDRGRFKHLIPQGFCIMFAGNIGESQDFESVVRAADLLREEIDIHWVILGDGRRKQWLETEIRKLGLDAQFHLLGNFPQEEMPHFFVHADVMLVTLKDSEIFRLTVPAKIQSYLASGRPILAMLNGEGARIVDESEAGVSCSAGDYRALADNIRSLRGTDRSGLERLGLNAKMYYVRNFSREMLFRKFEKVYADLSK